VVSDPPPAQRLGQATLGYLLGHAPSAAVVAEADTGRRCHIIGEVELCVADWHEKSPAKMELMGEIRTFAIGGWELDIDDMYPSGESKSGRPPPDVPATTGLGDGRPPYQEAKPGEFEKLRTLTC
jgi:hypothetical protein